MRQNRTLVSVGALLANSKTLKADTRVGWQTWRSIVGYRVASHTMPTKLDGGTLHVTVSSAIWASELSLLQAPILERLRKLLPSVRMLRFRVGQVSIPEVEPPTRVVRAEIPPTLSQALDAIEDVELRRVIGEAAAYSLGRKG